MLDSLITSKTRVKLLLRLFLNPDTKGYLRGLADEFKESTNAVRLELNRLEDAGMLISSTRGNKNEYSANIKHPLNPDIQSILRKITGIDEIIERVVRRLGGLNQVYLTGYLASGSDDALIDLVLIGAELDSSYLNNLVSKAEQLINRKIRTLHIKPEEFESWKESWSQKLLLVWSAE